MIQAVPLYPCVHTDAYTIILDLLGEDVAHQLLYSPWGDADDRFNDGAHPETVEGWLRARVHDHDDPVTTEAPEESAAQCP